MTFFICMSTLQVRPVVASSQMPPPDVSVGRDDVKKPRVSRRFSGVRPSWPQQAATEVDLRIVSKPVDCPLLRPRRAHSVRFRLRGAEPGVGYPATFAQ